MEFYAFIFAGTICFFSFLAFLAINNRKNQPDYYLVVERCSRCGKCCEKDDMKTKEVEIISEKKNFTNKRGVYKVLYKGEDKPCDLEETRGIIIVKESTNENSEEN